VSALSTGWISQPEPGMNPIDCFSWTLKKTTQSVVTIVLKPSSMNTETCQISKEASMSSIISKSFLGGYTGAQQPYEDISTIRRRLPLTQLNRLFFSDVKESNWDRIRRGCSTESLMQDYGDISKIRRGFSVINDKKKLSQTMCWPLVNHTPKR
jgi:hypothetical protein